jgi:hypothetical protein
MLILCKQHGYESKLSQDDEAVWDDDNTQLQRVNQRLHLEKKQPRFLFLWRSNHPGEVPKDPC